MPRAAVEIELEGGRTLDSEPLAQEGQGGDHDRPVRRETVEVFEGQVEYGLKHMGYPGPALEMGLGGRQPRLGV